MILAGIVNLTIIWFSDILPIRLIWLAPLFIFIGGGHATMGSVFYAIGSDITTEANR